MIVNFKRLSDLATVPTQGSTYSAGYDLYAAIDKDIIIYPHTTTKIPTDIAMEIPEQYFGATFARSGIATKRGLRPANCTSVIDSDYRGNIIVPLHNDTDFEQIIKPKERIAQMIFLPYLSVEFNEVLELSDTERGADGFGHSGKF